VTPAITDLTSDEHAFINAKILEFNRARAPFTQDAPFVVLAYGMKDRDGVLIGGILAVLYCWQCLSVESLWVDERYHRRGYGTALMRRMEAEARDRGCGLMHLDTFDFQAKEFYVKLGYDVFGVLTDCPPGHERYYLKKDLKVLTD
jgi:GNAT superfamily N-acetyltransferase